MTIIHRAQGCLLGQFVGDALGSVVEFCTSTEIKQLYPEGLTEMTAGGDLNLLAGQITDDSELALCLARSLIAGEKSARGNYMQWFHSEPFDCGATINCALAGYPIDTSESNGAMMRISPLGIAHNVSIDCVVTDTKVTHDNKVCIDANIIFVCLIRYAIRDGFDGFVYYLDSFADSELVHPTVQKCIVASRTSIPEDFYTNMGWVAIALQNALYHARYTVNVGDAITATVMQGGDTDTNAAICGALLGAIHGIDSIPNKWIDAVLQCQADRPQMFRTTDAFDCATKLLTVKF